ETKGDAIMSQITSALEQWDFNRTQTLATLDALAQLPEAAEVLGWRPAPARAHIAWQLMHIAITEELFATERLLAAKPAWPDLVPRFKGGSTPDDVIPTAGQIRDILRESREHLVSTISAYTE